MFWVLCKCWFVWFSQEPFVCFVSFYKKTEAPRCWETCTWLQLIVNESIYKGRKNKDRFLKITCAASGLQEQQTGWVLSGWEHGGMEPVGAWGPFEKLLCPLPSKPGRHLSSEGLLLPQALSCQRYLRPPLSSMLSSHGRGIKPQDASKKNSRGLSRGVAGNPGFPWLVPMTSGSLAGFLCPGMTYLVTITVMLAVLFGKALSSSCQTNEKFA